MDHPVSPFGGQAHHADDIVSTAFWENQGVRINRLAVAAGAAGALGALAATGRGVNEAMGGMPVGERLERMRRSPQWEGTRFRNRHSGPAGVPANQRDAMQRFLRDGELRKPPVDIPLVRDLSAPSDVLSVTWMGHASAVVDVDGLRILLDPVWSARCSPSQRVGPRRLHAPPVSLAELGRVDAVVISHDHYDHLDMDTVKDLADVTGAAFVVPLGIGAHLERWGVPERRVVELDWDESYAVGSVTLTCVEAQHFSGRGLRRDGTLWGSWVVAGEQGRVFFSGDTGYFPGYAEIAAAHGGFDAALMAIGAYDTSWPTIHLNPEEAVQATADLTIAERSPLLLPIHWCTFTLAPHPWSEPVTRMLGAADQAGVTAYVPRLGERVQPQHGLPDQSAWWLPT